MKARIRNNLGTWEFELHEDGRADLVAFTPPEAVNGLGDVVAKVTKAVGIKPCGPCQKRREALNRMVPFNGKPPADASLPEGTAGGERAGEAT